MSNFHQTNSKIYIWHDLQQCSGPEIYRTLLAHGINISQRSVTHLMRRYKELVSWPSERIKAKLRQQEQVMLAIDGLHETLWVVRDCLSAEILLAHLSPSLTRNDLDFLLKDVKYFLRRVAVPVKGLISNGEETISSAVASVFPNIPQFH